MPFIAYKITHRESGKAYVGITTQFLRRRWKQHVNAQKHAIGLAIRKYGADEFSCEHIASAKCTDDLIDMERMLIAQYQTMAPLGYNLVRGGDGNFDPSEETLALRRAAILGRKHSEETRAKLRKAWETRPRVLPPRSDAHRANLSASLKGCKFVPLSIEARAKISAAHIGRKRPKEVGAKISAIKLGKPRTEAAKAAMRAGWAARKARLQVAT